MWRSTLSTSMSLPAECLVLSVTSIASAPASSRRRPPMPNGRAWHPQPFRAFQKRKSRTYSRTSSINIKSPKKERTQAKHSPQSVSSIHKHHHPESCANIRNSSPLLPFCAFLSKSCGIRGRYNSSPSKRIIRGRRIESRGFRMVICGSFLVLPGRTIASDRWRGRMLEK